MRKNYCKLLISIGLIIAILVTAHSIGIQNYINFKTVKDNRASLLKIVKRNYWFSVLTYIVLYIGISALSIPIAAPLTLISGFLFDVIPAVIYTNIGATIGATLTFIFFRYFLGKQFQRRFSDRLANFNKNIERYGAHYLLIIRLIAAIPFFLVNILAAFTAVSLKTFITTTAIGIIPGSIVFAYAGKHIVSINSMNEVFSSKVIFAFLILIAFGLLSLWAKKYLIKKGNRYESEKI